MFAYCSILQSLMYIALHFNKICILFCVYLKFPILFPNFYLPYSLIIHYFLLSFIHMLHLLHLLHFNSIVGLLRLLTLLETLPTHLPRLIKNFILLLIFHLNLNFLSFLHLLNHYHYLNHLQHLPIILQQPILQVIFLVNILIHLLLHLSFPFLLLHLTLTRLHLL